MTDGDFINANDFQVLLFQHNNIFPAFRIILSDWQNINGTITEYGINKRR